MDLDELREIAASDWRPVSTPALAVTLAGLSLLGLAMAGSDGWVPLLDSVNLAFHEAGHPFVGLLSERLEVYGGTLFQLLVPLIALGGLWARRDAVGCAVTGAWFFQNFQNIARYMADARAQELPLVGGGEHDWYHIFIRWNLLGLDTRIAALTRGLGFIGFLGCLGWLGWRWQQDHARAAQAGLRPPPAPRPGRRPS